MKKDHPHPVPIVVPKGKGQHKFSLDEKALRKILLQDHVRDRNLVVVSIAGAFRKGKSFLLGFFLRYMNYFKQTGGRDSNSSWLGDENTPLKGFSWRGGSKRDTTGILMWSEVFCVTLPTGEEVAVIFLDTQGTFDSKSTLQECVTVFALSTMLSSIQIYNLSKNIQEDDLQNLQFFAEYGRLASESSGNTPFQKLQFIVRDWDWAYEKNYGPEGGTMLLEEKLMTPEGQDYDKIRLRTHIKSCFTDIHCFLLPDPGPKVRTCVKFDGKLPDIHYEFKSCLEQLVPLLLSPENLIQKEIGGQKITAENFLSYFKCYMDMFNSNVLPEPKSIFDATVEVNNLTAVAASEKTYQDSMKAYCETKHLNNDQFEQAHQISSKKAFEKFDKTPKMGGVESSVKYRINLQEKIDSEYNAWKLRNESKKSKIGAIIFKTAGTVTGGIAGAATGARIGSTIGVVFDGPVGIIIGGAVGAVVGGVAVCLINGAKTAWDKWKTH
ncbi:atlastin-3-like [Planococcus citri]|uniref:atlastin-3-like n=1 Tax=Planococcus citri TaxID=170843 RepID=UPI0031F97270